MNVASIRVLVVDDYEAWRRFVCSTCQQFPQLRLVGEASDGLEALQKAQELQPDLIVLDIGLPNLNGIQAAHRIRQDSPRAKILFVSENRSFDVVEEALKIGAGGYVVKSDAGSDLLLALEAVLQGQRPAVMDGYLFVGSTANNNGLYAVNANTGAKLWDFTSGDSVFSSPAIAGGIVYFGSSNNSKVYALDAKTGTPVWTFSAGIYG